MRPYRYLLIAFAALCLGLVLRATTPIHVDTGSWASAGQMSTVRTGAASVLLPDGRVMIIGGADANGNPLNTTEFFNPNGTFSPASSMSTPRTGHAAIWLLNGEVLVTGGTTTGGGAVNSAESFDPLTGAWRTLPANLVEARTGHTLAQLADGSVLVVGGENAGTPITALETYSLFDETFSFSASMPAARKDAAAAALPDGRVLIAGGSSVASDGTGAPLASTLIYDPATATVSDGPAMSAARVRATATSTYDGAAIIGGNDGTNDLGTADIYSAWSNTFRTVSGATPRSGHVALLLPNNGGILVTGGTSGASADVLQPWRNNKAGQFLTANPSPTNHDGGFVVSSERGLMLAAGGKADAATSADLYGFATIATDKSDYAPGTTVVMTGAGFQPGETVILNLQEWVNQTSIAYPDYTVTADASGAFTYSEYAPTPSDLNSRYHLTAIGQTSGVQAQTVFTDGNARSVAGTVKDSQGNGISGVTVSCTSGCNSSFSTTTGTNGTYSFTGGNKLAFDTNGPVTLTLTASKAGYTSATKSLDVNNNVDYSGIDFVLTPSTITVTASVTAKSKTYDGSNAAEITGCTLSGVAATDASNVTCSATSATFDNKNFGAGKTVTATGISLSGSAASRYTLASTTAQTTADVNPATLTYTADPVTRSYNTDNPTFTGTVKGFVANESQTSATTGTLTFTTTATKTSSPGTYAINGSGLTANNGNYIFVQAADNATALTIGKATQTITFDQPATPAEYNTNFTVNATSNSGLAVSVVADTGSSCTVAPATVGYTVHMTSGIGNCVLIASQTGDSNYSAAEVVQRTVEAKKANQTLIVTKSAPATAVYNTSFTVAATGGESGNPIVYTAAGVCSNSGATFTMTSGTGTCTVKYDQAGDSNYNAATQVTEFVTAQKANQAITVTIHAPATAVYNTSFTVAATGGESGNPIVYSAAGVCSNSGATFTMTSGTGTCTVKYDQAGDSNYNAATQVTEFVTAQKANQTITVTIHAPATAVYNTSFTVAATGGESGNPIVYNAAGVCSNSGATFTMTSGTGSCTVRYDQGGNDNYNAATQVTEPVTAQKAKQGLVSISAPTDLTYGQAGKATASGGIGTGPFVFSATGSTGCSIDSSGSISVTNASGTCSLFVYKRGDSNYLDSDESSATVKLHKATISITPTSLTSIVLHRPTSTLGGRVTSPTALGPVPNRDSVSITLNSVLQKATIISNQFSSDFDTSTLGIGSYTVTYAYGGSDNFNPASATSTLAVTFGSAIGFFQPWAAPPGTGFKAGSTIPLKWQWTDYNGAVVDSRSVVPNVYQDPKNPWCLSTTSGEVLTVLDDSGSSGYQYDPITFTWQYNWKTPKNGKGLCYQLNVSADYAGGFADGNKPTQLR